MTAHRGHIAMTNATSMIAAAAQAVTLPMFPSVMGS